MSLDGLPRSIPPKQGARLRNLVDTVMPQALRGGTRAASPRSMNSGQQPVGVAVPSDVVIAIVFHDDSPNFARPDALIVYWIGAAFPDYIADFDFWYNANVDH